MKNLKKQNSLRLPGHFLKDTGLDQERSLLAALFPGVILLTRRFPSPQEREEIGEGLSCVARDLDLPLGTDGLVIPDEMLEDAGLPSDMEKLEFFVEDGRIVLEAQMDFEQELLADAWEEAEEDEILSQLPQRLRDFFRDLEIHPATVRDVMLRGGAEE